MTASGDLEVYVATVEAAFTRLRGRVHELSPHDFGLCRAWFAAGVPLALVVGEIERAFTAGEDVSSLAYLKRRVDARAARSGALETAPATGTATAPEARGPRGDVAAARAWLARVGAWLGARGPDAFTRVRAPVDALQGRLVEEPPDAATLEAALATLDAALDDAALTECGPRQAALFRRQAARAAARQRGRLDDAALEDALRRYERRRAREALGVPARA